MRSVFDWQQQEPVQLVLSQTDFSINKRDFVRSSPDQDLKAFAKEQLLQFLEEDKKAGMELSQGPLMRVSLLGFEKFIMG